MRAAGHEDGQKKPDSPSEQTQSQTEGKAPPPASTGKRLKSLAKNKAKVCNGVSEA
jgi:hypothetical protein